MLVGAMFGAYGPINLYARKRDCFSRFWQLGLQFVEYNKLADGTDISTFNYVQLGINALQDVGALKALVTTCSNQLEFSENINWLQWYMPEEEKAA